MSESTKSALFVAAIVVVVVGLLFGIYKSVVPTNLTLVENQKATENEKILVNTPMHTDAELTALYRYRITMRNTGLDEKGQLGTVEERAYTNDWTVRIVTEKMLYAPTSHQAIATARVYELRVNVKDAVLQNEFPTKSESKAPNGISLLASFGNSWNVEIVDTRTGKTLFQEAQDQLVITAP